MENHAYFPFNEFVRPLELPRDIYLDSSDIVEGSRKYRMLTSFVPSCWYLDSSVANFSRWYMASVAPAINSHPTRHGTKVVA